MADAIDWVELTKILISVAQEYEEAARTQLTQNGSNVTGQLANSIKVQSVRVTQSKIVVPTSMLQYGIYVDNGAERGRGKQPPVQDIKRWIEQKRISVPSGFTVDQFAWAVAKSIGRNGQRFKKARPFIQPSLDLVVNQALSNQTLAIAAAKDIDLNIQLVANATPGLN